ncbi:MAG: hypothetical protein WC969_12215 [Elusimicrobiota bacterium]
MKDKVALLMEETGCDRAEAELALELCSYDLQSAVQAVPRLFQNILVLKGRLRARHESLYGLWLAILNLKDRSLLRARAVVSYNPAVYTCDFDAHWFDFEGRLYACRLWAGTLQDLSQEAERLLAGFFDSSEAAPFFSEKPKLGAAEFARLQNALAPRLGEAEVQARAELLDMGQFQEVLPAPGARKTEPRRAHRPPPGGASAPLVLRIALEPAPEGVPAGELKAGDLVYTTITDGRDVAQYLAKLISTRVGEGSAPLPAPVEAIERGRKGECHLRVRFSAGLCGDVTLPPDVRIKVTRRGARSPWWKRIFGG